MHIGTYTWMKCKTTKVGDVGVSVFLPYKREEQTVADSTPKSSQWDFFFWHLPKNLQLRPQEDLLLFWIKPGMWTTVYLADRREWIPSGNVRGRQSWLRMHGAHPSCHWAKAGCPPGQVGSLQWQTTTIIIIIILLLLLVVMGIFIMVSVVVISKEIFLFFVQLENNTGFVSIYFF